MYFFNVIESSALSSEYWFLIDSIQLKILVVKNLFEVLIAYTVLTATELIDNDLSGLRII